MLEKYDNILKNIMKQTLEAENNYKNSLLLAYFESKKEFEICRILAKGSTNIADLSDNELNLLKEKCKNHKLSFCYRLTNTTIIDFIEKVALMKDEILIDFTEKVALMKDEIPLKLNLKWYLFITN